MKRIEKYLVHTVLQSIFMILACLVALQIFILFVNQMGDLGKGNYHFAQAMKFVFLRMPYEITLCFPVICLMGCLVGLSILANNSELVILRANGLSILNILRMVATAGIGLIILMMVLAECFVPTLMFKANNLKLEALNEGHLLRQFHSVWFRNQENFWYIASLNSPYELNNITLFKKDQTGVLRSIIFYPQAHWTQGTWFVDTYEKTYFQDERVKHQAFKGHEQLELPLNPKFFRHVEQHPDEMSLISLWQRIHQLKKQQNIAKDELIFWQRLLQPVNALLMMLLAIPCIFGPLRSVTMGARLVAGIALGFGFYILNQMFGFVSQVYQIPPIFGASMPLIIFGGIGMFMLTRVR